ncbi:MAG: ATP-binding protein, partial [Bacillota bacterium]
PIAEVFEEALNEKKLSLKVNMPDYSVPVNIDKVFFDQILIYLLENSIKYTNEGGIVIDVKLEKDENSTDEKAIISISDTGIGIDNKKHKMIFEEFRQASEGLSREYEGTGLGLTIAQKLASMLNGRISIKSEIGKGATFFLEFPGAEHVIFDN